MGFRNPPASVTVVDTRYQPAGAGVVIEQDNTNELSPRGIVRFTDGFAGDGDARVYQHAEGNPRAQNAGLSGGLTMHGGSYAGVAAPDLDLAVRSDGAGGTYAGAWLTGAPLVVDRPVIANDAGAAWQQLPLNGAWVNWDTGANQCAYRRDASGEVHVRGIAKLAPGGSIGPGASYPIGTLPDGFYLPNIYNWRTVALLNASGVPVGLAQAYTANNSLIAANLTATTATAGFGFAIGLSFPTT